MLDVFGLGLNELTEYAQSLGLQKFRGKQIFQWMYEKSVFDFAKMSNLGKSDIALLQKNCTVLPNQLKILDRFDSSDGITHKFLIELRDGATVETVLMHHDYGYSICLSSQVGCDMGCVFCASTLHGCVRSLTMAEILAQFYFCNMFLKDENQHITRIVVMGSGEPMLNFDNVFGALEFLHREDTSNISYRNMTISTCGIIPGIKKMMELGHPINLAISLHAVRDELRSQLMPVNKGYSFVQVIDAAENYSIVTGREVTYEYILLADCNDSEQDAKLLGNFLRFKHASVNLIPANPVPERNWRRSSEASISKFIDVLNKFHVRFTIRKEMGSDIGAACGQLRNKFMR